MRSELKLKTIRSFDNDVKRLKKKHYDMSRLEEPLRALGESDTDVLKTKYSDHALTGDWKGFRELHVESDLLLVYRRDGDEICSAYERGTVCETGRRHRRRRVCEPVPTVSGRVRTQQNRPEAERK